MTRRAKDCSFLIKLYILYELCLFMIHIVLKRSAYNFFETLLHPVRKNTRLTVSYLKPHPQFDSFRSLFERLRNSFGVSDASSPRKDSSGLAAAPDRAANAASSTAGTGGSIIVQAIRGLSFRKSSRTAALKNKVRPTFFFFWIPLYSCCFFRNLNESRFFHTSIDRTRPRRLITH